MNVQSAKKDGMDNNPLFLSRFFMEKRILTGGENFELYTERLFPLTRLSALTSMGIMLVVYCNKKSTSALFGELQ